MTTHVRKHFENTDEFLAVFKLNEDSRYERATNLLNEKIGFSVQRTYPPEFRYKPPKLKNGEPDTVALIYVSYDYPRTNVENEGSQLVPVAFRIVKHSRYIAQHFDYNFEDEDCPTEESVLGSKVTPNLLASITLAISFLIIRLDNLLIEIKSDTAELNYSMRFLMAIATQYIQLKG